MVRPMGTTAYGGKGSNGRAVSGDRPIGATSCRPKHTKVSYHPHATRHPPHPRVPCVGTEIQYTHHRHKGGARGYKMRLP